MNSELNPIVDLRPRSRTRTSTAASGEFCAKSIVTVSLRAASPIACRAGGWSPRRAAKTEGARGFVCVDPDLNPAQWEVSSAKLLRDLTGESAEGVGSAVRTMRGVLRIAGLPAEDKPPPAPYDGKARFSEIPNTLINVFGTVGLINGCSFAYASENDGHIVRDVVARHDARRERSSQGWAVELPWHTDGAFRPLEDAPLSARGLSPSPRWLVFGVIYDQPSVPLTFACVDQILDSLSQRDIDGLARPEFDVHSPESFSPPRVTNDVAVLVPDSDGGHFIRFNQLGCCGKTPGARNALGALNCVLRDPGIKRFVELTASDVVVLDNWRTLHMRSAYIPRWDGADRWLIRVYVAASQDVGIPRVAGRPRIWE